MEVWKMIFCFCPYSIEKLKFLPRRQKGIVKFGKYNLEYPDSLSLYFEYKDIFKNRIYHFISRKLSPVIIDAGGYIGMSVLYFKSVYPRAKITVFEPDPNNFLILEKNIKNNGIKNIKLINAGIGKTDAIVDFFVDGADGSSILKNSDNFKADKVKAKIVKLSKYINSPVDLLKMNIEGAESEVFEEIKNKLHFVRQIIFEYHAFYNLPQKLGKILRILDRHGFRYVVTDATSAKIPTPLNLQEKYRYFNLIYAKHI